MTSPRRRSFWCGSPAAAPRAWPPTTWPSPLCGAVYKNGFVKNKVLEFAGPAVSRLPMDYRIGIDVMTTETACLSSIWETDEAVADYLALHGRPETFTALHPQEGRVLRRHDHHRP